MLNSFISPLTTILVDVETQSPCNIHFRFIAPNSFAPGDNLNINIDCHNYIQGYSFHIKILSTRMHIDHPTDIHIKPLSSEVAVTKSTKIYM